MAQQWRLVLCVVLLALSIDVSAVTGRGGKTHKRVSSLKLQARTLQRKLLQHESAAQELRDVSPSLLPLPLHPPFSHHRPLLHCLDLLPCVVAPFAVSFSFLSTLLCWPSLAVPFYAAFSSKLSPPSFLPSFLPALLQVKTEQMSMCRAAGSRRTQGQAGARD